MTNGRENCGRFATFNDQLKKQKELKVNQFKIYLVKYFKLFSDIFFVAIEIIKHHGRRNHTKILVLLLKFGSQ